MLLVNLARSTADELFALLELLLQQPAGPAVGRAILLQSTGPQEPDVIDESADRQRLRAQ